MIEKQVKYAPIVVFAFNRLTALNTTIDLLKTNPEAKDSDLFVFVDGARPQKADELKKVEAVQEYVKKITGFRSLNYKFAPINMGLGPSIITGVSEIVNQYGKVIVLEDDLAVAKGFLAYMNTMLDAYESDKRIMQISGFSTKVDIPKNYTYDIYLNRRGESWSWGTWKDRWSMVDWDLKDFSIIKHSKKMQRDFNNIGSDLYGMLLKCAEENAKIWAVRFCYSMFKNGCYQVSPIKSLVRNDGFGTDSTNCNTYNRYKYTLNEIQLKFTPVPNIQYNRQLDKSANRYWTKRYRIFGKIMSMLYK